MKEVQQELFETCLKIKSQTDYYYVDYCFLEVLPPFIKEGLNKCLRAECGYDYCSSVFSLSWNET